MDLPDIVGMRGANKRLDVSCGSKPEELHVEQMTSALAPIADP
jgi:hypothetical protein